MYQKWWSQLCVYDWQRANQSSGSMSIQFTTRYKNDAALYRNNI